MQSRWPDLLCGSRPAVLMRAGRPVAQPETLRYSGSCEFSWFFRSGELAACTTRRRGFGGCKGRIRGGSHGERKRDVVPRPPAEALSTMLLAPAHKVHGERSEEHTSDLQSLTQIVCRLLLER